MKKSKALTLSILCLALSISFIASQQFMLVWAFLAPSTLFFGIWIYKYQRDLRIISQARLERAKAAQVSPSIPQTSQGSRRLFVPPPIN